MARRKKTDMGKVVGNACVKQVLRALMDTIRLYRDEDGQLVYSPDGKRKMVLQEPDTPQAMARLIADILEYATAEQKPADTIDDLTTHLRNILEQRKEWEKDTYWYLYEDVWASRGVAIVRIYEGRSAEEYAQEIVRLADLVRIYKTIWEYLNSPIKRVLDAEGLKEMGMALVKLAQAYEQAQEIADKDYRIGDKRFEIRKERTSKERGEQ